MMHIFSLYSTSLAIFQKRGGMGKVRRLDMGAKKSALQTDSKVQIIQ
jgi:hypothetical protein